MAKSTTKWMGFYRPHARVRYTGELLNLATGEVTKPIARTKQSFVEECDINNVLKQYKMTGQIRHISDQAAKGAFVDLPAGVDFQEALHTVMQAERAFESLPSGVRNRFQNDPQQFLEFFSDPANLAEAKKLGLLAEPVAAPTAAPAPNPTPAPPPVPEGS